MRDFAEQIGGLPGNVCAMTTVTGPDALHRVEELRQTKASCRGLSIEPLWECIPPESLDLDRHRLADSRRRVRWHPDLRPGMGGGNAGTLSELLRRVITETVGPKPGQGRQSDTPQRSARWRLVGVAGAPTDSGVPSPLPPIPSGGAESGWSRSGSPVIQGACAVATHDPQIWATALPERTPPSDK